MRTDSAELLQWATTNCSMTAQQSSIEQLLQQWAAQEPEQLLTALLSDQHGLLLLLQQLPQYKEAIRKIPGCLSNKYQPLPPLVSALHTVSDAATPAQLQQLVETLLQHMQPEVDNSTAEAAAAGLASLYRRSTNSLYLVNPAESVKDLHYILFSLESQLLLAKALDHSSQEVMQTAASVIVGWDCYRPWRGDIPRVVPAWIALKQRIRQQLQLGAPGAARWYYLTMEFQKYEPDDGDYVAMLAAAAAELHSLQQLQLQQQEGSVVNPAGQSIFALATACCLANSAEEESRWGRSSRRFDTMTARCSAEVALWLFGPQGLEAASAAPQQAAAATATVAEATKQLLIMMQLAVDSSLQSSDHVLPFATVLKRVSKAAAVSTGMADSDWLLAALQRLRHSAGVRDCGWLFKMLVQAVPEPLQHQLVSALLQELCSGTAVALTAAACLKGAAESAACHECDRWSSIMAQQQHWELLLEAWNSGDDAVADAAELALVTAWPGFEGRTGLQSHIVLETELQVQAMQRGSVKAAMMLYGIAQTCTGKRARVLLPHLPAILAAAAEDGPTQAAAVAALCVMYKQDYTGKVPQELHMADQPAVQRWLLDPRRPVYSCAGGSCSGSDAGSGDNDMSGDVSDADDLAAQSDSAHGDSASGSAELASAPEQSAMVGAAATAGQACFTAAQLTRVVAASTPAAAVAVGSDAGLSARATGQARSAAAQVATAPAADVGTAAAAGATGTDAAADAGAPADAVSQLPACLVLYLEAGRTESPRTRQEKQQQQVMRTVLEHLTGTVPAVLAAAAVQQGWLPSIVAWDAKQRVSYSQRQVAQQLAEAATPELLQQISHMLLQDLVNAVDQAAVAAALNQINAVLLNESCRMEDLPGILAQQQQWQLLLQLQQHEEAAVADLAVRFMCKALIHAAGAPAAVEQRHMADLLPQQVKAAMNGSRSAFRLLCRLADSMEHNAEAMSGALWLEQLLPMLPDLHEAAAAWKPTSSRKQVAALQALQLCCLLHDGRQHLLSHDCAWLTKLVQPHATAGAEQAATTADAAQAATAAAVILQQLVRTAHDVHLLGSLPQILHAILQHLAGLPAAAALQRREIRSCCNALLQAVKACVMGPDQGPGTPYSVFEQLPVLLQIMLQGGSRLADTASEMLDYIVNDHLVVDHYVVDCPLMQQQSVDLLVQVVGGDHSNSRYRALDMLDIVAEGSEGCGLLAQPQAVAGLFGALRKFASDPNDDDCPSGSIVDLIAAAVGHVCNGDEPQAVSDALDRLLTSDNVKQLAGVAAGESSEIATAAVEVLAEIATNSSLEMQLQLASLRHQLQTALQRVQKAAATARQAQREEQLQQQGAIGPPLHLQDHGNWLAARAEARTAAAGIIEKHVQEIESIVQAAMQVASKKLSEAMHKMHEVAGAFAEQYAAYRTVRHEWQAASVGLVSASVEAAGRPEYKKQRTDNGSGSTMQDLLQNGRQQLQAKCDSLVPALDALVGAAADVNRLQELILHAEQPLAC